MNRSAISASLLLVLGSTTHAESLRSMILKSDAVTKKALLAKDFMAFQNAMKPTLAANFKYIEAGKSMTFDEMMVVMKQGIGTMQKITSVTSTLRKLTERGGKATAEMTRSMSASMVGPDKKSHNITMSGRTVETYVKQGSKWKLAIMDWKSSEMVMDGKKVDPTSMGGQ